MELTFSGWARFVECGGIFRKSAFVLKKQNVASQSTVSFPRYVHSNHQE
jgi:hypothetical protein